MGVFMAGISDTSGRLQLFGDTVYKYRTTSIEHLEDMQKYMNALRKQGLFSKNKVFRSYVDSKSFKLPDDFQDAKFIIVLAVYTPLAIAHALHRGRSFEILIPPNYQIQSFTVEQLKMSIIQQVIREKGYRIRNVSNGIFLKHLAVRSGLAKYGRNNICYVEEMGSMFALFAFYTDYVFSEDHWNDLQIMDCCKDCRFCFNQCPTHAISDESFIIDVEKCLPLYNEVRGEMPTWMPASAHNALIGCMRCQLGCPANKRAVADAIQCQQLTESDVTAILENRENESTVRALCSKLKVSTPESAMEDLPVFSRNLSFLLK
jgi:epoxyqueuosine reductase